MSAKSHTTAALLLTAHACCASAAFAAQSAEERNLNELRNTVINLLQTLVERGVVTREQAEGMVSAAQKKAAEDAAAAEAQDKADEAAGAVRVPYVPEIVKEEIRKQVAADLVPEVAREVADRASSEGWGVPAALPDWVRRVRWYGDVRVREEADLYATGNAEGVYFDYQTVNDRGGIIRAERDAYRNTTQDRVRMRTRLRVGLESELGWGWSLGTRLTTGDLRDPVSTNQTLGNTGGRYQTGFDLGYLKWYGNSATGRHVLNAWGGRIPNPWLSTDLVWDPDLTFEGVALNYRLGLVRDDPYSHYAFVTLGAFPIQEVALSSDDKWLYAGQLGFDWTFSGGSRARFGVAYYRYENIVGQKNALNDDLLDYTAPQFLQGGNTLFDIRNTPTDPTQNLFALASDYHLANATFSIEARLFSRYRIALSGDYVKNIGFDADEIFARSAQIVQKADTGYHAELSLGAAAMDWSGAWRASFGYKYLEADAVLDAFTDSDFHLGGTDAKGYIFSGEYAFTPRVIARIRYFSANEIDGAPLGVDVLQFDVNARF